MANCEQEHSAYFGYGETEWHTCGSPATTVMVCSYEDGDGTQRTFDLLCDPCAQTYRENQPSSLPGIVTIFSVYFARLEG